MIHLESLSPGNSTEVYINSKYWSYHWVIVEVIIIIVVVSVIVIVVVIIHTVDYIDQQLKNNYYVKIYVTLNSSDK